MNRKTLVEKARKELEEHPWKRFLFSGLRKRAEKRLEEKKDYSLYGVWKKIDSWHKLESGYRQFVKWVAQGNFEICKEYGTTSSTYSPNLFRFHPNELFSFVKDSVYSINFEKSEIYRKAPAQELGRLVTDLVEIRNSPDSPEKVEEKGIDSFLSEWEWRMDTTKKILDGIYPVLKEYLEHKEKSLEKN
jgi:hypothetical protein